MKNAEYIRTMTDKQLAAFIAAVEEQEIDFAKTHCNLCEKSTDCDGCYEWWLKQDTKMPHFGLEYWKYSAWNQNRDLLESEE